MSGGKESYQGRGSREIETHRTGNRIPGSPRQTLKKEVPDVDDLHLQQDEGQVFFYSQHTVIKLLCHGETGHFHLQPAEERP